MREKYEYYQTHPELVYQILEDSKATIVTRAQAKVADVMKTVGLK